MRGKGMRGGACGASPWGAPIDRLRFKTARQAEPKRPIRYVAELIGTDTDREHAIRGG
jgi:hypothetical protein